MSKYNREYQLARLIGLWPQDIADTTQENQYRIVNLLEKALRGETKRGREGHWTYDINRHLALLEAWRKEKKLLRKRQPRT